MELFWSRRCATAAVFAVLVLLVACTLTGQPNDPTEHGSPGGETQTARHPLSFGVASENQEADTTGVDPASSFSHTMQNTFNTVFKSAETTDAVFNNDSVFVEDNTLLPNNSDEIKHVLVPRRASKELYTQLVRKLLSNNPFVPPNADDPSQPVNVNVSMVLQELQELDMRSQTIRLKAWMEVNWHDKSLSWDTAKYPYQTVLLRPKKIWRPSLAMRNSLLTNDQLMTSKCRLRIESGGLVRWFPGGTFLLTCQMDIERYPFDTQTCHLFVNLYSMLSQDANGTVQDMQHTIFNNGEWKVLSLQTGRLDIKENHDEYWVLDFSVTLKRKWLFYTFSFLLPVVLVSSLNCLVLALPVECGERMSVSVTCFLTLTLFMTLMQDNLPNNSNEVCYLGLYLTTQMILGALAVATSTAMIKCHHHGNNDADDISERSDENLAPPTVARSHDESFLKYALYYSEGMTASSSIDQSSEGTVDQRAKRSGGCITPRTFLFPVFFMLKIMSLVFYLLMVNI